MKPIEEGCTAIVIESHHTENIGKLVQVGRFIGKPGPKPSGMFMITCNDTDMWEVNVPMAKSHTCDSTKFYEKTMPGHLLQRLDDTEENELVKTEIEERV